jgi:hypothetical protein
MKTNHTAFSQRGTRFRRSTTCIDIIFVLIAALVACSCSSESKGYHQIVVGWAPGHENVPDCTPLIKVQANGIDIKGVSVPQVGLSVGGVAIDPKALQTASDGAMRADQAYVRLCQLLPAYSNDKNGFYTARDKMFDLISVTLNVANEVANATGQTPAKTPSSVPTEAPKAAKDAGTDPAKAVANPETKPKATAPKPLPATKAAQKTPTAVNNKLISLGKELKRIAQSAHRSGR